MFKVQKLESIEIRPAEKVFKVNGEDFGDKCNGFSIDIYADSKTKTITTRLETYGAVEYEHFDLRTGEEKESPSAKIMQERLSL